MDKSTLALLQDRLLVRVVTTGGRLYARLALYEQDAVAVDKVAQLVDHPQVRAKRTPKGYLVLLVQAQGAVVEFCNVVLPHLHEGDPLHAELVFAQATAQAPWYERYELLAKFLEEE